jgi:hypothetical protein
MGEPVDFQSFREQVDLYFDKALDGSDEQKFLNTISQNQDCKKVFEQEQSYRNFIKTKVHRPSVSPDFIRSIKDKIRVV